MDSTKTFIPDDKTPKEAFDAFNFNRSLLQGNFEPTLQGEVREDGTCALFLSADSKAAMFYSDCQARGVVGRIINDEVTFSPFNDFVIVTAKCYIYVDDVLRGTGVAGQVFQLGQSIIMDRVVQYASGLAKSRALSNAGFGVISSVNVPAPEKPNSEPAGDPADSEMPFTMSDPAPAVAPIQTPATGTDPVQQTDMGNDPMMKARNVYWPKYRQTLGELLAGNPGAIIWAAETMTQGGELKDAAKLLYPEACRLTGKPQKPLA